MVRGYLFNILPGLGPRPSLAARGQFLNTFAGPGFCLVLALLALGGYLIAQEFENPVQAHSTGLLVAALLIPTAITLLYCLLHPSRKLRCRGAVWPAPSSWERKTVVVARCNTGTQSKNRSDLPLHGRYVDRTRIRIEC
jgi:hypothetical protein